MWQASYNDDALYMRQPQLWLLPTQPIARSMLLASGVTRGMIATQISSGRLLVVRHGVYLAADAWPDAPQAQHLVLGHAEQVANPGAVLSHQTAAVSWGLPSPTFVEWHDLEVCITSPPGSRHGARKQAAQRRVIELPKTFVTKDSEGYEVTNLPRTATDLAYGRPLPESLVILDAATRKMINHFVAAPRRSDYANPHLIQETRNQFICANDRLGLRSAIALSDPRRESVAESLSAGHLHVSGLPTPDYQTRISTPRGTLYPDFFWQEHRVVGEVDGAVKYDNPNAYVEEKRREQILRDLGYTVVRWLASEIMLTPGVVMDRIARALSV